jgi:hypothetical protein
MFAPWTHTNPAKLVCAFTTSHVVTSAILFNGRVAAGTFFCICGNPVCCFGIVFAFFEPFSDEGTETGLVVGEGAAEAEAMATAAADGGDDMVELGWGDVTFNGVLAIWRGTPFKVVVVVDIRAV